MNSIELLIAIIREHSPEDIWRNSPLVGYRHLGNTNRGQIGEEFVRRYLRNDGIQAADASRRLMIGGIRFEVKTASMGANGSFQFNHVRLDRQYAHLLCVGICPNEIVYGLWRKGIVAEGGAGHLVRMAEGQAVTWKLTKLRAGMMPIDGLPAAIRAIVDTPTV